VRLEPLGLDRHYNRYWMLPAPAAAPHADFVLPDAPPVLVVERHSLDSLRPVGVEAASAALGQQGHGASGGGVGVWHVGLYSSILHLQQLAQWLNPKGTRERPLAGEVTRLLDQHQQFAMQHPQLPRPPAAEERPPLDAGAQRAAAVARLQQALLSFEEGNQGGTYDDLAGSEQRRQTWRAMVAAASTPQVGAMLQGLAVLRCIFCAPQHCVHACRALSCQSMASCTSKVNVGSPCCLPHAGACGSAAGAGGHGEARVPEATLATLLHARPPPL
jgi:hypothetical protein